MAAITTLAEARTYIKRNLGWPVNNVEIHQDQLDTIIEDSISIFCRYNYGEGSYFDYMLLTVTSGIDEYSLSGNNIQDIYDFQFSMGVDGINTLFSPTHDLLYDAWVVKGGYPGGPGGAGGQGMVMTDYQVGMMYLEEIKRIFGREYRVHWRPSTQILKLAPTPNKDLTGVLLLYKRFADGEVYNNILLKQLCVAKSKKLWGGMILGKSNITLPGGGTFNSQEIYQQGLAEEEKALERIEKESEPVQPFWVG